MKILDEYGGIALLSTDSREDLEYAAKLIKSGELVGIPTETVYGLGANALDSKAVKKIYIAKGRPSDNPLIVHIDNIDRLNDLVHDVPQAAYNLAEKFWPGPLTMILPKNDIIPVETSGGLDTVGIRMPNVKFTRDLITEANLPIAAPSANISGYPSPTKAEHVCSDLRGKIKAVADGGTCIVGVESTVISFEEGGKVIRILRPGYITPDDLKMFAKRVIIDKAITEGLQEGQTAKSPGMKYKHYSPRADVIMIEGDSEKFEKFAHDLNLNIGEYIAVFDDELKNDNRENIIRYGKTPADEAKNLFSLLRDMDKIGAKKVYVHTPDKNGVGLAVYNRLIRAAGFEVIHL